MRVWGQRPNGVQGQSPWSGSLCPPWSWWHFLISETNNFLTKLSHKFGKFRLHGKRQRCLCERKGWEVGHSPAFHIFLQQASADCHCMLAGESMISSRPNMTISAFYRTHKLRFNVPRTYLCLIIRNKIGLPPAIGSYSPIQIWTISLSPHFHPLTIVLFTSTFYLMAQPFSVSRPIICQ